MSTVADCSDSLRERVVQALESRSPLDIRGGDSKSFYGRARSGSVLSVTGHSGIIDYEPSELVITARAGTPLHVIEQTLAEHGQMLAFEAPRFSPHTTLGGSVASGLSGPRRPFAGAPRDFVLGAVMINGRGEQLRFGGQVMKNVAGYDLPRLLAGSLGTLGVLLEISLKVLPAASSECTLVQECSQPQAIERFSLWMRRAVPLSAACWHRERLYLRISGSEAGVRQARQLTGGDEPESASEWWASIRDQTHTFFQGPDPLWRLSLPQASPPLDTGEDTLIDWAGGQRWLVSTRSPQRMYADASALGGHACLYRNGDRSGDVFQPLPAAMMNLHQRVKQALDPAGIFNPGRLYSEL